MADPMTMRRQLRAELRRLRAAGDLTQRQVAETLYWSPSKVIRIENGQVAIGVTDLQALLRLYKVENGEEVDRLIEMAKNSKHLPFSGYKDALPAETLRYFAYESSALRIRQWEPLLIPGLLQTEEYARALLTALGNSKDRIDIMWSARDDRQDVLDRDDAPEMFFILDEAAVRRTVGSEGVMQGQRARLLELNARPNLSIQVLPFRAGAHAGMLGPFVYLEFAADGDPDVLYIEGPLGDSVFRDDEEVTVKYLDDFFALERSADPKNDLKKSLGR